MVSGDFNLDGKADLALLYSIIGPGTAQVQVMLGNGDGTFNSSGIFDAGLDALSIAVADFNGDGKPDLAVTGIDLQVLAGKGDGTFSSPAGFDAGITPRALGVADFNGDAKLDVAVGNFDSKNVTVLLHK
jgi:hypothetical protein